MLVLITIRKRKSMNVRLRFWKNRNKLMCEFARYINLFWIVDSKLFLSNYKNKYKSEVVEVEKSWNMKAQGIHAAADVYHTDVHAFDMMKPELSISDTAAERFNRQFAYAKEHFFAPQKV